MSEAIGELAQIDNEAIDSLNVNPGPIKMDLESPNFASLQDCQHTIVCRITCQHERQDRRSQIWPLSLSADVQLAFMLSQLLYLCIRRRQAHADLPALDLSKVSVEPTCMCTCREDI